MADSVMNSKSPSSNDSTAVTTIADKGAANEDDNGDDATKARPPKRKREHTRQACKPCRDSKAKCDGQQPICTPCTNKGRDCHYEFGGPANVPRQSAMKARLESLEHLFSQLKSESSSKAQNMFEKLRANVSLQALLTELTAEDDADDDDHVHQQHGLERAQQRRSQTGIAGKSGKVGNLMESLSITSPDGSFSHDRPLSQRQSSSKSASSGPVAIRDAPAHVPTVRLAWRIEIPTESITKAAFENFFDCAGQLLHVFTREQANAFHQEVFHSPFPQTAHWKASACCLCALAAIGKVYDGNAVDSGSAKIYYDVAKSLFEDLLEVKSLDAIKVCTLLALYNIFDKATLALVHVEVGMSLARFYGLETNRRLTNMPRDQWIDCRKAWRTLLFFKSWLCFTLGYMAGDDILAGDVKLEDLEITDGNSKEDMIQAETAKISVLIAKVLRIDLAFNEISPLTVQTIWKELEQWHLQLPKEMSLEMLGRQEFGADYSRSVYYIHLLYQGAGMLLYRRIMSQCAQQYDHYDYDYSPQVEDQPLLEALLNGRRLANITSQTLQILLDTDEVFKRCWLVIFQAFTAGTLILYEASQKQLHNFPPEHWLADLKKVEAPLAALEYCGQLDPVAHKFHNALLTYHKSISHYKDAHSKAIDVLDDLSMSDDPRDALYLCRIPMDGDQILVQRTLALRQLLCRPYGNPQRQHQQGASSSSSSGQTDPRRMKTEHLDWHLGSSVPFHWDAGAVVQKDHEELESLRNEPPNLFLGSTQPLGWEGAPADVDMQGR